MKHFEQFWGLRIGYCAIEQHFYNYNLLFILLDKNVFISLEYYHKYILAFNICHTCVYCRMMATEVRETPRSMITQFIQHHQSSKTSHRPGLRNRIRSTSLGEGPPADTQRSGERTRRGQRITGNSKLSTSEFTPHGAVSMVSPT